MPENDTANEFASAVSDIVEKIRAAGERLTPADPAPAPAPREEVLDAAALNTIAETRGVGGAIEAVGQRILLPMQIKNYEIAARSNFDSLKRDPDLGKWAKKHAKQIEAQIKANPVKYGDEGVESLVVAARNADEDYLTERAEARATQLIADRDAAAAAAAAPPADPAPAAPARHATERPQPPVYVPPVTRGVPAPAKSEADAIAAIEVTAEEVDFFTKLVPSVLDENGSMRASTADDLKRQRYERLALEEKHGAIGLRQLGGYPICSLEDIGHQPR